MDGRAKEQLELELELLICCMRVDRCIPSTTVFRFFPSQLPHVFGAGRKSIKLGFPIRLMVGC